MAVPEAATGRENSPGAKSMQCVFRPPATVRCGTTGLLNRALFSKTVSLAAATVHDNKNISRYRRDLEKSKELLRADRVSSVVPLPAKATAPTDSVSHNRKCLLLDPRIRPENAETWGPILRAGVASNELGVVPYQLDLDYTYFTASDVLTSLLPGDLHGDLPTGFNTAGHVAHLNLRAPYLPYKKLIADVIVDKNPHIRTVINKIDKVGTESEFRTFAYEVLVGSDDLDVCVRENDCLFHFDYAKVYWNSKLETEHTRLISLFQPGQLVVDVMAGIGPFAVPAGRKRVFVWANDKNPESYRYLAEAVRRNKVEQFVRPFNEDGQTFIHQAADSVYEAAQKGERAVIKPSRPARRSGTTTTTTLSTKENNPIQTPPPTPESVISSMSVPPTISHFVMNLPANAIEFVHHFRGLYAGHETLFAPYTATPLPLVHAHCFAVKSDGPEPLRDICARLSAQLGVEMHVGDAWDRENEVVIHDVRDVAPLKRMFCASFRVPACVAFAARG